MRKPASTEMTSASVELRETEMFVSCTYNLLVQMFGFQKCTKFHLKLTSSLQGLLQNQSLEVIQVYIAVLYIPHNNIVGMHLCDECTESKRAKR